MRNPLHSIRKRLARLKSFPQLAERQGAFFLLDPGNWIDNRLLAHVPFESQQLLFARSLITGKRLDHVIDIGANFGLYSVLLGRLPEIQVVHAFEPVRRNFNQLCGNIFSNRLDKKATLYNVALGLDEADLEIFIDPASTGVSRLDLRFMDRDLRAFSDKEIVQVKKGDSILKMTNQKVFVKIDVEGQTYNVLSGLSLFLNHNSGVFQIEADHETDRVRDFMTEHGWNGFKNIGADFYFEKA